MSSGVVIAQSSHCTLLWSDLRQAQPNPFSKYDTKSTKFRALSTSMKQFFTHIFSYIKDKVIRDDVYHCKRCLNTLIHTQSNKEFGANLADLVWTLKGVPRLHLNVNNEALDGSYIDSETFSLYLNQAVISLNYNGCSISFATPEQGNVRGFLKSFNTRICKLNQVENEKNL